ncbi:uncharacterized protein [Miscanthus floridulus]|uniref:uncharacterized protein n=1 Tax=Miscanthus floridulus TaxID=154761 RepID=UPI003457A93D
MRRIDKLFNYISPVTHQIRIDVNTPLHQACDIDVQMQAGLRCPDAFQVYNPEVVRLKAEATQAISEGALARILKSEIKVLEKIERTRQRIIDLEKKISALELDMATGAHQAANPNDEGTVQFEQVIYPEVVLRDGASQLAFWKLNLKYLQSKEEALVDFFKALCSAYNEFETAVLEERTRVGSGYSDYTFSG